MIDPNKEYSFTLQYAPGQKVVYTRLGHELNDREAGVIIWSEKKLNQKY